MKNPMSTKASDQSDSEENDFSIADILAQILARKWIVVFTTVIGIAIGMLLGQLPPDQYRASSVVNIEQRNQGIELPEILVGRAFGTQNTNRMGNEIHIIRSRLILGPVVDRLNLDWRVAPKRFPVIGHVAERRAWPAIPEWVLPAYTRHGDRIALDLLEVDKPLINRKARIIVTGEDTFDATIGSSDETVSGKVGETVTVVPGFRFRISRLTSQPGRVFSVWRSDKASAIRRVRGGLSISPRRGSTIVDFRYVSGDPNFSRKVANAVVDSYQTQNLSRRSAEIDQSIAFIDEQLPEVRRQTAEAAKALSTFRQDTQVAELTVNSEDLLNRIVGIEAQLEEVRYEEEQLARRLTPNHPDYRELLQRKERLEQRLDAMRDEAANLPPLEQELLTLTQNLERMIEIERQLTSRSEQLNIIRASTVSNIHVLEPAARSSLIGPDRTAPIMMGLVIGLITGIGGILGLNFMRPGIDDTRSIEELGLPLFASINRVQGLRTGGETTDLYPLARTHPSDIVVEALRGLRTGLQFSLATAPARSLMITSPAPSVGKSFISLNLSIVAAQAGSRVLLIDADMRKGKLRRQFNMPRKHKGLSDFLADEASLEDVLVNDEKTGVNFIGTGSYPPNPADLLTSATFRALMEDAPKHFDLVIVDCPPILAVTDPGIVGQMTGMSLLVIKHLETTKAEVIASQKLLDTSGIQLSGAILNQFDAAASRYGQYGHKYGYYGGYKYQYK